MSRPRRLGLAVAVAAAIQQVAQLAAEDVLLQSQEDVVRFGELGISEVDGSLKIQSAKVTDLRPLAHVRTVSGGLSISETGLTSLEGLEGLTSIGGFAEGFGVYYSLEISENEQLTSLTQLRNLRGALRCGLHIVKNWVLPSLDGLENITSITPDDASSAIPCPIILEDNRQLHSLLGLSGLSGDLPNSLVLLDSGPHSLHGLEGITGIGSVGGQYMCGLTLDMASVSSLQGLSGLRGHLPGLWVSFNRNLKSLEGLENVTSLGACADGKSLHLERNDALQSLAALLHVSGPLGGAIHVDACPVLETLAGLEGATSVVGEAGEVSIWLRDNTRLRSIEGLRGLSGSLPGSIFIQNCEALASLHGLEGLTSVGRLEDTFSVDCGAPWTMLATPNSYPTECSCIDLRGLPLLTSIDGLGRLCGNVSGSLLVVGYDSSPAKLPQNITGFVGTCDHDGVGIAPLV